MVVSEGDLYNAILLNFMTAAETINAGVFTAVGTPAFEGSTSAFPNSRNEKFVDLDGSTDRYQFDGDSVAGGDYVFHAWIKPDFTQADASSRCIVGSYSGASPPGGGLRLRLNPSTDDWRTVEFPSSGSIAMETTGETWAANDVIHMCVLCKEDNGLDNGKSLSLYINNVLKVTATNSSWTPGNWGAISNLGADFGASPAWQFDGGLFDISILKYSDLSGSYTDAEIVQALYDNSAGLGGGTHTFNYELGPGTTPGLTIAGRKVRVITDTGDTPLTALEIDNAQVTQIGTPGTNYLKIEKDGTIEFNGDATVWDDYVTPLGPNNWNGVSNNPTLTKLADDLAGTSQGVYGYAYTNGDESLITVQMPHRWKEGSTIWPHIHFMCTSDVDPTDNFGMEFEYWWADTFEDFPANTVLSTTDIPTGVDTNDKHQFGNFPAAGIDGTGHTISSILMCRIKRVAATANDYVDPVIFLDFDIHYEIDTVGSRTKGVK